MVIAISGKMQSGKNTVASIIQYLTSDKFKASNSNTFDKYKSMNYDLYKKGFIGNTIWQQVAFAGKLKQIVSILTGIPAEDMNKQEVKDKVLGKEWWYYKGETQLFPYDTPYEANKKLPLIKPTVREKMVEIADDIRAKNSNAFVNALFADYKPYNEKETLASASGFKLETDLIYPNWIITDLRFPNELQAVKDRGGIIIRVNREYKYGDLSHIPNTIDKIFNGEHKSETALDNAEFDHVINNNEGISELIKKVKQILIKEKII